MGIPTRRVLVTRKLPNKNITLFTTASAYKLTTATGTEQPTATYGDPLTLNIVAVFFPSPVALPITLLSFQVGLSKKSNHVEINWSTVSEINNDFFTIERSKDNLTWEAIETIEGKGNGVSLNQYEAVDPYPLFGISYFRLKQTDHDGTYSFSEIKSINFNELFFMQDGFFPNPATNEINLTLRGNSIGIFNVINESGKICNNQLKVISITDYGLRIDVSALPSGLYFLKTSESFYSFRKL